MGVRNRNGKVLEKYFILNAMGSCFKWGSKMCCFGKTKTLSITECFTGTIIKMKRLVGKLAVSLGEIIQLLPLC